MGLHHTGQEKEGCMEGTVRPTIPINCSFGTWLGCVLGAYPNGMQVCQQARIGRIRSYKSLACWYINKDRGCVRCGVLCVIIIIHFLPLLIISTGNFLAWRTTFHISIYSCKYFWSSFRQRINCFLVIHTHFWIFLAGVSLGILSLSFFLLQSFTLVWKRPGWMCHNI